LKCAACQVLSLARRGSCMEQTTVSPRVYRFGSFELSVEGAELRKSGVRLKLQEQPFHVLCALLEHPGELVSREQLRQQLWPEGTFVDFEHGLNTAIKKLRDVFNDDADTPAISRPSHAKGTGFLCQLTEIPFRPSQRRRLLRGVIGNYARPF
jgi:DNA-binding response OmpR family regulator